MPAHLLVSSSAFVVNRSGSSVYRSTNTRKIVRESPRSYGRAKKPLGAEAILHLAWRNAGLERAEIRGRDGHSYLIVYSGKPGGSLGPDFTDAVVKRDDGITYRGDIEIHVRESDWRSHGHHNDPRYNGVVLHVVAAESDGRPALKATGSTIPLLALNRKKSAGKRLSGNSADGVFASALNEPPHHLLPELPVAEAGLDRFHSQAAGIALDIDAFGADQAIWLGVLGALGYPRNKRAFRTLAGRVNWRTASNCKSATELESLLIHGSGLRNSSSTDQIRSVRLAGSAPDWVRPYGRPANAPQARIKAVSTLVPLWNEHGGLARYGTTVIANAKRPKELAQMFRPLELVENEHVTTLGAARAAEIVVNVLLPAMFAIATRSDFDQIGAPSLKNRAIELFSKHPKLAGNSLVKEAEIALGIDHEIPKISTARDQQGLIALYREMFRHGINTRQPRLPGV